MVGADEEDAVNGWGMDKQMTPSQLQGPGQMGYEAQEKQADSLAWCSRFYFLLRLDRQIQPLSDGFGNPSRA